MMFGVQMMLVFVNTIVAPLITVQNHRQKVRQYTVGKITASSEAEKK